MSESSSGKKQTRAKSPRLHAEAAARRKLNRAKPAEKTSKNYAAASSRKRASPKTGSADARLQKQSEIERVEPTQEPLIKASDLFTFTKRTLSPEARELLAKIDEGGIPLIVTQNLERIAKAHGIEVSREMTPNEIVRRLRRLA